MWREGREEGVYVFQTEIFTATLKSLRTTPDGCALKLPSFSKTHARTLSRSLLFFVDRSIIPFSRFQHTVLC